jgi:hypothetical protein
MAQMHERQRHLSRLLLRALEVENGEPYPFGGCYLAATGARADRQQAFIAGVMHRLLDEQNAVWWTEEALDDEEWYERWTQVGYLALAAAGAAALLGLAWALKHKQ